MVFLASMDGLATDFSAQPSVGVLRVVDTELEVVSEGAHFAGRGHSRLLGWDGDGEV